MANAASPKKSSRTTKPAPIDIKGRPGGGYLQWVTVPRASKPDLNLQVRWNLFGLPIGVVVYPPNKLYLGKLVVPKRTATDSEKTKRPRCTFVESAYELLRQTGHITSGYAKEVDALRRARNIARDANHVALTADPKQVTMYQQTMARLVAAFDSQVGERVRDQDKVQGRQQMAASASLTDRLGRPNPRAEAARTQAAVSRVTHRTVGATGISARIRKRRIVADGLISFAEQLVFAPLLSLATTVMSDFEELTFSPGVFTHRPLHRCRQACRLIDWRPHVRLATSLAAELNHAIEMLHRRDSGMILAHFIIIREILDLQVAQSRLHEMITEIHNPLSCTSRRRELLCWRTNCRHWRASSELSSVSLHKADRN